MSSLPTSRPTLVVFSDDWGRHPSSCQHLVRRLVDSYEVIWVNTIGLRAPDLSLATARRGVEKLAQWFIPSRKTATDEQKQSTDRCPQVFNPKMWPWFTRRLARTLNWSLLTRQVNSVLRTTASPRIAITTLPITSGLVNRLNVDRWLYYRVDDFGVWPGVGGRTMKQLDKEMIAKADSIISVSNVLRRQAAELGRESCLLTHGVDIEHWRATEPDRSSKRNVQKPVLLFWGVVDRRMDAEIVIALSQRLPECAVVLVGPQDNPDPRLCQLPNVQFKKPVDFAELPQLAATADVLMMPYADMPVTRAIQPLKLKEYLATGRPVVARSLPATCEWADCLDIAASADEFVTKVNRCLEFGVTEAQRIARRRLDLESWDSKAAVFKKAIADLLHEPPTTHPMENARPEQILPRNDSCHEEATMFNTINI